MPPGSELGTQDRGVNQPGDRRCPPRAYNLVSRKSQKNKQLSGTDAGTATLWMGSWLRAEGSTWLRAGGGGAEVGEGKVSGLSTGAECHTRVGECV